MFLCKRIKNWFERRNTNLKKLKGQTNSQFLAYKFEVDKQSEKLARKYKWDNRAIRAYVAYIKKFSKNISPDKLQDNLEKIYEQTKLVGSRPYTILFQASDLSSKDKLELVLSHLGAYIDDYGFLQLDGSHKFANNLKPHSTFCTLFRYHVMNRFNKEEGLNNSELGHKIHLFRSNIDKQNIDFIRNNFKGSNDFEKLQDYSRKYKIALDYSTAANFHNRVDGEFLLPKNMKIQAPRTNKAKGRKLNNARMAEFILDLDSGNFVSQWNVYRELEPGIFDTNPQNYTVSDYEQIANGESYNYGIPWGRYRDIPKAYRSTHRTLDIDHPADPMIRRAATRVWKTEYSPKDGGRYLDIVKRHEEDFYEWQRLSHQEKEQAYMSFSNYALNSKKGNKGFADFIKRTKGR